MWPVMTRRRDVVIQERLAIDVAKWVISSDKTVAGVLDDAQRERFFRLVERALESDDSNACWQRFSKYVMTVFEDKESWVVVKKRFYAARRKQSQGVSNPRSIQVSEGVYEDLLAIREHEGVTFSEVIDILLGYREAELQDR